MPEMGILDRIYPDRNRRERWSTARYDFIIIRGAPGVGKSTLAKNLKKHFPNGASVEVDYIRGMINSVEWIHAQQDIHCIEAAWAAGHSYLANGYWPVLFVDSFWTIKYEKIISFINALPQKKSYHTIVLYCADEELISRITHRKKGFSDIENSLLLNRDVRKQRHRNETFIDTTGRSLESVLDEVLHILK